MTIAIFGGGLVGQRCAAQVRATYSGDVWLVGHDRLPTVSPGVQGARSWLPAGVTPSAAVVATAPEFQVELCERLMLSGIAVVSAAGEPAVVNALHALRSQQPSSGTPAPLIVGAAYAPGLSSLLAAELMQRLDETHEVHFASFGTGGPACARAHHRAMTSPATEVRDRRLHRPRSGTGRQLVWFPEPVGGADCYFGGLVDPFLLHQAFPAVDRVQARMAATRRDRMTGRLPMLRPPHPEGLVGAVVVEVRGMKHGRVEHLALAASAPQATGAAHVAATFARRAAAGLVPPSLGSVVACEDPTDVLAEVAQGVTLWSYDGSAISVADPAAVRAAKAWRGHR